jgi:hypothetical protein
VTLGRRAKLVCRDLKATQGVKEKQDLKVTPVPKVLKETPVFPGRPDLKDIRVRKARLV